MNLSPADLRNINTSLLSVVDYKRTYLELFQENLHLKSIDSLDRLIINNLEHDLNSFYSTIKKVEKIIKKVGSSGTFALGDV